MTYQKQNEAQRIEQLCSVPPSIRLQMAPRLSLFPWYLISLSCNTDVWECWQLKCVNETTSCIKWCLVIFWVRMCSPLALVCSNSGTFFSSGFIWTDQNNAILTQPVVYQLKELADTEALPLLLSSSLAHLDHKVSFAHCGLGLDEGYCQEV